MDTIRINGSLMYKLTLKHMLLFRSHSCLVEALKVQKDRSAHERGRIAAAVDGRNKKS